MTIDAELLERHVHERVLIEQDPDGEHRLVLNMGPQHPATHGTLRLVLELEGEHIARCTPEIGFLHTGFEKLAESLSYHQFITLSDRMNYMSAMNNNFGYALAVEELLGIVAPERSQVLRVIMCELGRIADHVICTGLMAMDMGAFSAMLWCFTEREKCYDIFEACCGARLTNSYARIGGLARDVPEGFDPMVRRFCHGLPGVLEEIEALLDRNKIWLGRMRGVGVISRQQILDYAITGPIARASGVDRDLRRDEPYFGYETYAFEVPVQQEGDGYARYKQRVFEMRQSLRLIEQALDRLKPGEVQHPDYKLRLPTKEDVYTDMESLIHHFKLVMEGHGLRPRAGDHYRATEAPNGELGFYIVSDGSGKPWRLRVRPPSFINYASYPEVAQGVMISDAVAILSSYNVIAGELDR